MKESYSDLMKKFPFLTVIKYGKKEYIGLIQNEDINITSVYILDFIKSSEEMKEFISLGSEWWWETNRKLPINIVIGKRFNKFDYCLVNFSNKNFEILHGPSVKLRELIKNKSKKRNIQLIRDLND